MKRRHFLSNLGTVSAASLAVIAGEAPRGTVAASGRRTDAKIGAGPRTLAFWDLWHLDYWDNLEHVQGKPRYVPEADYVDMIDGKGAGRPSVYFDGEAGLWRMLYNMGFSPVILMAAESKDGIHWKPSPHSGIEPEGGKKAPHHLFTLRDTATGGVYIDPVADDGYRFKMFAHQSGETVYERALENSNHRWHRIAKAEGQKKYFHDELMLVSRDGLRWEAKEAYAWGLPDWHPEPLFFGFYNEEKQRHVMTVRPGWGDRRVCVQDTADFRQWSGPELLFQPDPLDDHVMGFYGMPVYPSGPGYIGLLWVFHNASSEPLKSFNQFYGTMDCQLAYSYDGVRFVRGKREAFIGLNPSPQHGSAQLRVTSMVETEKEIRFYSGAAKAPHGMELRLQKKTEEPLKAITLHTLRKDGFFSLRSAGDWARFQTKPLAVFDPVMTLNADAAYGSVMCQLTDVKGEPVDGFTFDDFVALEGEDRFDWPLRWKNRSSLEEVAGKVIRLEVKFQNAEIYSLRGDYHFLDAQDYWMLEDGKEIDTRLFDF